MSVRLMVYHNTDDASPRMEFLAGWHAKVCATGSSGQTAGTGLRRVQALHEGGEKCKEGDHLDDGLRDALLGIFNS